MMLADLGADAIKIESSGTNAAWRFDMKVVQADRTLIRQADGYIQNLRPGTAERLGAGVEQLRALKLPGTGGVAIHG